MVSTHSPPQVVPVAQPPASSEDEDVPPSEGPSHTQAPQRVPSSEQVCAPDPPLVQAHARVAPGSQRSPVVVVPVAPVHPSTRRSAASDNSRSYRRFIEDMPPGRSPKPVSDTRPAAPRVARWIARPFP